MFNVNSIIKVKPSTKYTEMLQRNYKWESKEMEVGRYTATLRGSLPDDSSKVVSFASKSVQALFNKFPVQ